MRFDTQEQVGSVHVAIQSIAPFEDYIGALQPTFALTADQALTAAIQQTQTEDSQLFQALVAALQVATPTAASTFSKTVTNGTSTSSTETHTSNPGDTSKITLGTDAAKSTLATPSLPSTTVGIDQSLKYRAAAALFQEVGVLNNYVRDAAVRKGMRPYVVRMLVTLTPAARNMPYDAYTTISFFAKDDAVEVIPLLVTDTFESSLHQDATEHIRNITAALKGSLSGFGADAAVRSQLEEADKTLGENINSLFSIARLAPNAVQARLGAMYANGQFTMIARTYDVAVLLLTPAKAPVPNGDQSIAATPLYPEVSYAANTSMRDAQRGELVPSRNELLLASQLRMVAANLGIDYTPDTKKNLEELATFAERGDYNAFSKYSLGKIGSRPAEFAWNELLSVTAHMGRSFGTFALPTVMDEFFSTRTKGTLIDDGDHTILDLAGAARLSAERLSAALRVESNGTYYLNHTGVKVSEDGRHIALEFLSLNSLLGKAPDKVYASVKYDSGVRNWQEGGLISRLWYPHDSSFDSSPAFHRDDIGSRPGETTVPYIFAKKPTPPAGDPKFALIVPSHQIRADRHGLGDISIELRSNDPTAPVTQMHFDVDGAFIDSIEPALTPTGGEYIAPADGVYKLHLKNLVPGTSVTVKAFRIEAKKPIAATPATVEVH